MWRFRCSSRRSFLNSLKREIEAHCVEDFVRERDYVTKKSKRTTEKDLMSKNITCVFHFGSFLFCRSRSDIPLPSKPFLPLKLLDKFLHYLVPKNSQYSGNRHNNAKSSFQTTFSWGISHLSELAGRISQFANGKRQFCGKVGILMAKLDLRGF